MPEMTAASMDAASLEEAAMMAMLNQMQWQQELRPESVGKADIEEIVSSEEEEQCEEDGKQKSHQHRGWSRHRDHDQGSELRNCVSH